MSKKILVTGANSGIGYFLAKALLEKGHNVAAIDIRIDQLTILESQFQSQLLVFSCDLTDPEMVDHVIGQILDVWGSIYVVVNNACKAVFGPFESVGMEEIRKIFDVNVFGTLHVIRSVLPSMLKRNEGIIHNVSSGVGITGFQNLLGYASSKGAVETLTKCLALEYRDTNLTFNIIHPPLTNTPSASPIGLPEKMLEDPEKVGYALAKKIFSRRKVISPFWKSDFGIRMMKIFPYFMGRLFSKLTYKTKK